MLDDYPRGPGSDLLNHLMSESVALFADHPVNAARRQRRQTAGDERLAVGAGQGAARWSRFAEVYGKHGAMITAVDLLRGLAALIGWQRIEVPGATGYLDTDYAAKGRYAVEALADTDIICVHVEATDEASHEGDAATPRSRPSKRSTGTSSARCTRPCRLKAITASWFRPTIRRRCGPRRTATASCRWRLPAAASSRTAPTTYDEPTAGASSLSFDEGWKLMRYFLT